MPDINLSSTSPKNDSPYAVTSSIINTKALFFFQSVPSTGNKISTTVFASSTVKNTANLKDRDCSRRMRSGACVTEAENPEVCHVPLNRSWSQWETTCSVLGSSAALFVLAQLLERSHRVRLIAPCGIHLARRMLHMFGTMTPHYSLDWDRGRRQSTPLFWLIRSHWKTQ